MFKILKDNVTDLVDLLTSPNDELPQATVDALNNTPSSHRELLVVNDEGEVYELGDEKDKPTNYVEKAKEEPRCFVVPDKNGDVRFIYISKVFKVEKNVNKGFMLKK